jgi:hypothetical protein
VYKPVVDESLQSQTQHLLDAKYGEEESRWKIFRTAAGRAVPAMITFGLGGAAVTALGVGVATVLGISGLAFSSILPLAGLVGAGSAMLSGLLAGGAAATHMSKELQARNSAIDKGVNHLKAQALEAGSPLPDMKPQAEREREAEERENPAKDSPFIQQIIQKGARTLDPAQIVKRTAQDAGLTRE